MSEGEPSSKVIARPQDLRALVAIDLGAESCRVSLLRWQDGTPVIEMVYRFPNAAVEYAGTLHWDIANILDGLELGLHRCAEIAEEGIASVAVDGWAVDYVRLKADGSLLADPYCYRDERTVFAEQSVHQKISPERLYVLTGTQQLRINTLYQLHADSLAGVAADAGWINLPEYVLHWLGGRRIAEFTNATHTGMVDIQTHTWASEVFQAASLDIYAAPAIVPPGTIVGKVQGALTKLSAFQDTKLIAPACHDTASAIAGIPANGEDWAYISSGTWSLVGALLEQANKGDAAREENFTNLGAAGGRICFHKNVNGMWLLRQCIETWEQAGKKWDVAELIAAAETQEMPHHLLDLSDDDLLLPGDMPARINTQRKRFGLEPLPQTPEAAPVYANLIFHSLAERYAEVLRIVTEITGRQFSRIYIVGGGSRNQLLNQLTAQATGLTVIPGAVESSTIGNFAVQLAVLSDGYDPSEGAAFSAVAHWAGVLA